MEKERIYLAIDLKSFYASVECVERKLDPLTTNLVVADASRTSKTICLAVSPALKSFGIPGRPRLFQVEQKVQAVNASKVLHAPGHRFSGQATDLQGLEDPSNALAYITAVPRMALYMEYSARIYGIYLKYIAPEDIHVYSIDEVFMDVTGYLDTYRMTPHQLAITMIREVLRETGITATAGIGTNLYLAKIAMDIVAKHVPADSDGVRIAELDELSYRRLLWNHTPLTDFWRVGRGYAKRLASVGIYTMGDIARCSMGSSADYYNEDLLYDLFGVNAELLIDHAWGWEPVEISHIKNYQPENNSLGSGQVLSCAYTCQQARLVAWEMTDQLVLDLVDKKLVTNQIVLTIGYDIDNLTDPKKDSAYKGPVTTDHYGRQVPKPAHGSISLPAPSSSSSQILKAAMELYDSIVDPSLLVRRINVTAGHVFPEDTIPVSTSFQQLDLFTDYSALEKQEKEKKQALEKEKKLQHAVLDIKKKYGKNAILKGANLQDHATAKNRNSQIGGHKA